MQPKTKQELEVWGHWEFQNPLHASLCSKLGPRREAGILGSRQPRDDETKLCIMHGKHAVPAGQILPGPGPITRQDATTNSTTPSSFVLAATPTLLLNPKT